MEGKKGYRCIIAGCRNFNNYKFLSEKCDYLFSENSPSMIVSGGARGVDALGIRYALENNIKFRVFSAEWDKYGKAAGMIRNVEMAKHADALIAFWDGKSKGTKNMISVAKSTGLKVKVIYIS